jgi:protein involved in polysaccharide export with SLBB domain
MIHPRPCSTHRTSRRFHNRLSAAAFFFLVAVIGLNAQSAPTTSSADASQTTSTNPPSSAAPTASSAASPLDSRSPGTSSSPTSTTDMALSARQILRILQQKPEIVVELKSLLADTLQEQGISADADSMSDETLYNAIATSREVRARITLFLETRGYVSDEDLQAALPGEADDSGEPAASASPDALSPLLAPGATPGLPASDLPDSAFGTLQPPRASATLRRRTPPSSASSASPRQPGITDAPDVLHEPAPYNLMSLRDLYAQIPPSPQPLRRFGSDVFVNRSAATAARLGATAAAPALDVPVGPDYVLGPGDSLTINLWGSVAETITRVIDRDGALMLPEAGQIRLAGLTLDRAQALIAHALQQQYRDAQVAVTLSRVRSIRIYVVGDVQSPGAYDISALSSPISALYAAGGPTAAGSLRILRHFRGNQFIGEVDLYDFLLHGIRATDDRLEGGDTLLVPPVGPQVAVSGAIRRPAIYELKDEKTLDQALADAGGLTVAAALGHIRVERIDANRNRETLTLNSNDPSGSVAAFAIKDGDRVTVEPILPWSQSVVYLEGHVVRPGRTAWHDGLRLNDVLHSYRDLLPEPSDHGEIIRLVPPDLHPETIDFDVADALIGNANPALQPFDTIRILGRYEADPPRVTVSGEVLRPGLYPLSAAMTAAQLVRMAGGFRRDALLDDADLISYRVVGGTRVVTQRTDLHIGAAVQGDAAADAALKPGDVLTIHQITGWNDIGSSITIEGEVAHPGSYGFQQGERLSDLLRRAGGFRDTAYPEGALLTRPEVRSLEEKSRDQLIRQIETSSAAARLSPSLAANNQSSTLELIQQQEQQVLDRLRSEPPSGRLVIHISADISSWAGSPADIEVRNGDVLRIPKRPGFVLVSGQVYNATAITFSPGKTAGWYLSHAGGATAAADRKDIFVIRANGSVIGRRSDGWYGRGVLNTRLDPGDVVVVPQKIIGASLFWRNLLSGAQVASSIAIAAAVATL